MLGRLPARRDLFLGWRFAGFVRRRGQLAFGLTLGQKRLVALGRHGLEAAHHAAGAGRDETADNDLLLRSVPLRSS